MAHTARENIEYCNRNMNLLVETVNFLNGATLTLRGPIRILIICGRIWTVSALPCKLTLTPFSMLNDLYHCVNLFG